MNPNSLIENTSGTASTPIFHRAGPRDFKKPKPKAKATGHEAFLIGLQQSGGEIKIITNADELFIGRVKHSDKFTISLDIDGETNVFFKHAIERFVPMSARPEDDAAENAAA